MSPWFSAAAGLSLYSAGVFMLIRRRTGKRTAPVAISILAFVMGTGAMMESLGTFYDNARLANSGHLLFVGSMLAQVFWMALTDNGMR